MTPCTCGQQLGACHSEEHDGATRITWRDAHGDLHVNGTGVVIDEMTSGKFLLREDE